MKLIVSQIWRYAYLCSKPYDLKTILITSRETEKDDVPDIIQWLEADIDALHLRKQGSKEKIEDMIERIPAHLRSKIVIHGHYDLAAKYQLKGIHLRRRHREGGWKNQLRRLWHRVRYPKMVICCSYHSVQSLKECTGKYDYVLLKNVYGEHSKFNYHDKTGINYLKSAIEYSGQQVIAVGGITEEKLPNVLNSGFHGIGFPLKQLNHADLNFPKMKVISAA